MRMGLSLTASLGSAFRNVSISPWAMCVARSGGVCAGVANTSARRRRLEAVLDIAAPLNRNSRRQAEGQELAGVVAAADRDDDVLGAVYHVGHRRAALRGGHPHGAELFAGGFVVGA